MKKIVGIDIGGTTISIVLATYHENSITFIDKTFFPTDVALGFAHAKGKMFQYIEELVQKNQIDLREALFGISCGGPLDSEKGLILSPPNLVGWDNVNIVQIIQQRYQTKAYLQNDANACALAEWLWGVGQNYSNLVFMTFSTGLGAGLILDNRLYAGSNGMAGEVGHIRLERMGPVGYGKAGSFEGFCSGNGISQLAKSMILEKMQVGKKVKFCANYSQLENITAEIVFDAAQNGDQDAIEIVKVCGDYLGRGLSVVIDILNPQAIILGTIYIHNHELLYESLSQAIEREALLKSAAICKIMPASLGSKIGDYGSVATAIYGGGDFPGVK